MNLKRQVVKPMPDYLKGVHLGGDIKGRRVGVDVFPEA